ncbi:MAG: hypothetical protein NC926_05240 [Candidatus Omnitrophica bacterium]|nr:hypothetical protein [Candidatus Omnitrophota bacterium]
MGLSKRSSCGEINKKEWAYLEMFFDVPQYEVQPKYLQLLLIVEGTNKGIVWFDDISFSEIETIE